MREAGGRHTHHGENHLGGIPTSSATTRRAAATAAFPKLGWQTHARAVSRGGESFVMRMHGGEEGRGGGRRQGWADAGYGISAGRGAETGTVWCSRGTLPRPTGTSRRAAEGWRGDRRRIERESKENRRRARGRRGGAGRSRVGERAGGFGTLFATLRRQPQVPETKKAPINAWSLGP